MEGGNIYINYLEFCVGDLVLFSHSVIYVNIFALYFRYFMDVCFILWAHVIYFVTQSVLVLAVGQSFRLAPVLCLFDIPLPTPTPTPLPPFC